MTQKQFRKFKSILHQELGELKWYITQSFVDEATSIYKVLKSIESRIMSDMFLNAYFRVVGISDTSIDFIYNTKSVSPFLCYYNRKDIETIAQTSLLYYL